MAYTCILFNMAEPNESLRFRIEMNPFVFAIISTRPGGCSEGRSLPERRHHGLGSYKGSRGLTTKKLDMKVIARGVQLAFGSNGRSIEVILIFDH